jgi:hypothetical protein
MRWILPLFALPLVLAATACGAGSGISGRVTASPTCPVETNPPQPGCAPRGFKAHITITRSGKIVKRLTTTADGRFSVTLAPGRYRIRAAAASGAAMPRCPAAAGATVSKGRFTRRPISCDSGIR